MKGGDDAIGRSVGNVIAFLNARDASKSKLFARIREIYRTFKAFCTSLDESGQNKNNHPGGDDENSPNFTAKEVLLQLHLRLPLCTVRRKTGSHSKRTNEQTNNGLFDQKEEEGRVGGFIFPFVAAAVGCGWDRGEEEQQHPQRLRRRQRQEVEGGRGSNPYRIRR